MSEDRTFYDLEFRISFLLHHSLDHSNTESTQEWPHSAKKQRKADVQRRWENDTHAQRRAEMRKRVPGFFQFPVLIPS